MSPSKPTPFDPYRQYVLRPAYVPKCGFFRPHKFSAWAVIEEGACGIGNYKIRLRRECTVCGWPEIKTIRE